MSPAGSSQNCRALKSPSSMSGSPILSFCGPILKKFVVGERSVERFSGEDGNLEMYASIRKRVNQVHE